MKAPTLFCACVAAAAVALVVPAAADVIDPVASSNEGLPFPEDAENEPALTIDRNPARTGPLLVAGANDYHDQKVCASSPCQFQTGVGFSGVYYSPTGAQWSQGSYPGTTGVGAPMPGKIRTLPYFKTPWTQGDPALAAGPRPAGPAASPKFAWANGTRVYYSTLTRDSSDRRGVAVSRADPASATAQPSWQKPSFVQRLRADRPSVWVDDTASSPNFGHVYVCWTTLTGKEVAFPQPPLGPIFFARSADGGVSWGSIQRLHGTLSGRHGCSIRTDSAGRVYVFWEEIALTPLGRRALKLPVQNVPCSKLVKEWIVMAVSADGVKPFGSPTTVASVVEPGAVDVRKGTPREAACTLDGPAGARTSSWPSVDIANGAPLGNGPNTMVVAWADGRTATPSVLVEVSHNYGAKWSSPQNAADTAVASGASTADRPAFPAIALSPGGAVMYVVYTAFVSKQQTSFSSSRPLQGVVRVTRLADFEQRGNAAQWGEVRGQQGDARGSSNPELTAEFLGDYDAVVATNERGYAAWTDATFALDCPAVDAFRESKHPVKTLPTTCPAANKNPDGSAKRFGNVSICSVAVDATQIGKPVTSVDACALK
jgi:hypothetical protein